jgi:hypothetical protein
MARPIGLDARSASVALGSPDDMKLQSCSYLRGERRLATDLATAPEGRTVMG